jgi:predicted permease
MESLLQDLRFGLRALRKRPGLTLIAVVSLGLGIGANTTVFTWMNTFVLRPLPAVPGFDRIVAINTHGPGQASWSVSYPSLRDWRAQSRSLDIAASAFGQLGLRGEGGTVERTWTALASGNYFDVLGIRPALGRLLTLRDEDERAGVVVLGYAYWQRRFAGDSAIVGRHLLFNGHDLEVIGVAAPRFGGTIIGLQFDAFTPVTLLPMLTGQSGMDGRQNQFMDAVGRLRAGWTLAQARQELDGLAKRISVETGDGDSRNGAFVKPLTDEGAAAFLRPVLIALLGVTGLVLLIACANVANLLLARAIARRREIGIRLALGAGRWRLVRQLLTESLALGLMAGGVGVLVAYWSRDLFASLVPPAPFPVSLEFIVDGRVLLFALGVTLAAAMVFGLFPALQASNPALVPTLKDEIGGGPAHRSRLQSALVISQVALSLVSLVCAGLFLRSLQASREADVGFTGPEHVLLVSTDLQLAAVPDSQRVALTARLLERLRAVPGVAAASLSMTSPLGFGGSSSQGVAPDGYVPQRDENMSVQYYVVGSDYFRAMGIPVLQGRGIERADVAGALDVAVVSERFAQRFWPGQDPVGRRFRRSGVWRTVVGVAKQGKYQSLTEPARAMIYIPFAQEPRSDFDVIVRAPGDPKALTRAARQAFQDVKADLPFLDVRTMAEHMQAALFVQTLGATMLVALGAMALLLSAIGIFGVLSYHVGQRTREIGVRVALGAGRRDVVGMVVGRAMRLVAVGLSGGLALALGAGQLLRSQLIGVGPRDPVTFLGIASLLAVVALAASWMPARRAARVDPMVALRYE